MSSSKLLHRHSHFHLRRHHSSWRRDRSARRFNPRFPFPASSYIRGGYSSRFNVLLASSFVIARARLLRVNSIRHDAWSHRRRARDKASDTDVSQSVLLRRKQLTRPTAAGKNSSQVQQLIFDCTWLDSSCGGGGSACCCSFG